MIAMLISSNINKTIGFNWGWGKYCFVILLAVVLEFVSDMQSMKKSNNTTPFCNFGDVCERLLRFI